MATDNLELINHTYYASMHVPPDVRLILNKRRLRKTLKTTDKRVALHRVRLVVAAWWAEINHARKSAGLQFDEVTLEALAWRDHISKSEGDEDSMEESLMSDRAEEIERLHGAPRASEFFKLATGRHTYIAPLIEEWKEYAAKTVKPKTLNMYVSDVQRLNTKLKFLEELTKRSVRDWLWTMSSETALSEKTQGRILTALSTFWRWCHTKNYVPEDALNPFVGVPLQRGVKAVPRMPFTAEQVVDLWDAARARSQPLADLIYVGAYTGARIEELGSVKCDDVAADLSFFRVTDAKSKAGVREVPVHPKLKATLRRLIGASKDGYVVPSTAKNSLGQRAAPLGQAFGRLKTEKGHGPELVFHSIRKTVATMLENGGVPEGVAADIIGHEKATMTYGLYSGGTSMPNKAKAIKCLAYSFPLK